MRKHFSLIVIAWALSFVVAALIIPDLFIHRNITFLAAHDTESPFHNIFALINQWSNGGFSLFNRYDQSNLAYAHTTSGVYTVANVLTAFLYLLCAPFMASQSEGYQSVYILGFHGLTMLLRVVGGYLLLSKFKLNRSVMVISLIVLNTLLSLAIYQGLLTNNLYSYFPLLMFFILNFFEKGRLGDLLASVLVFAIAGANSIIIALGYFYEPVHFFILGCIVWSICTKSYRRWDIWVQIRQHRLLVLWVAALSILIILPTVWMAKIMSSDFFVAGSGVGGTHGRLQNIINRLNYFTLPEPNFYKPASFFMRSVNFLDNKWEGAYVFIGIGVLLLTLIALIFSKYQTKWIFFATIVLVIFANMPLEPRSLWSFAHWINVLTNPFAFLLHSFGMPAYLMLFAFLPLVALGLQVIVDMPKDFLRTVFLVVIGAILIVDEAGAFIYVKKFHNAQKIITPRIRYPLAGMTPVIVEYQNPLTLPFPEHIHALPIPVGMPVLNSNQNLVGLFYKYVDLERYALVEPCLYNPLPSSYKTMFSDKDEQGRNYVEYYVNQDTRWVFTAPVALPVEALPRMTWLAMHLDHKVALIDGANAQTLGMTNDPQEALSKPQPSISVRQSNVVLDIAKARKVNAGTFDIYILELPKEFPKYMASTFFTKDADVMHVTLGNIHLMGVQGKITAPLSFDINNIHQGQIWVALPKNVLANVGALVLSWSRSGEIIDYWRNTHDNIGFTYQAPHDGWMVMHMPYDKKWRLKIDGKVAMISRANQYFMASPITQGVHQVLLEYWPNNILKPLLMLSILLTMLTLGGLIAWGLRKESVSSK